MTIQKIGPHGRIQTLDLPGRNRLLCFTELRGEIKKKSTLKLVSNASDLEHQNQNLF